MLRSHVVAQLKLHEQQLKKSYLLTCAPKVDTNQPVHPCSLITSFDVCAPIDDLDQTANPQDDQNLRWKLSEGSISDVAVQMSLNIKMYILQAFERK